MEENKITIGRQEYEKLIRESIECSLLKNCLWHMAELKYSRDDLRFDGTEVLMKILYPDEYIAKLKELKEDEDNE